MSELVCFYCANTHNFTTEKCDCACHKVAPTLDKLEAIEKGLDWTIPQLIAIQKLLEQERPAQSREWGDGG